MNINLMLCKYIEHNKLYIEQFYEPSYIMRRSLQYNLYYPYDAMLDFKKSKNK